MRWPWFISFSGQKIHIHCQLKCTHLSVFALQMARQWSVLAFTTVRQCILFVLLALHDNARRTVKWYTAANVYISIERISPFRKMPFSLYAASVSTCGVKWHKKDQQQQKFLFMLRVSCLRIISSSVVSQCQKPSPVKYLDNISLRFDWMLSKSHQHSQRVCFFRLLRRQT